MSNNSIIFKIDAGINVSDIKKLQDYGLNTIGQVLQLSMRELISIKGLSEAKIEKIREAARKMDSRGSAFKTGKFDFQGSINYFNKYYKT